jgi:hypothetical protein
MAKKSYLIVVENGRGELLHKMLSLKTTAARCGPEEIEAAINDHFRMAGSHFDGMIIDSVWSGGETLGLAKTRCPNLKISFFPKDMSVKDLAEKLQF